MPIRTVLHDVVLMCVNSYLVRTYPLHVAYSLSVLRYHQA
jgi:hypothetical protein